MKKSLVIALALVVAGTLLLLFPGLQLNSIFGGGASDAVNPQKLPADILNAINEERAASGLGKLAPNATIAAVAEQYSTAISLQEGLGSLSQTLGEGTHEAVTCDFSLYGDCSPSGSQSCAYMKQNETVSKAVAELLGDAENRQVLLNGDFTDMGVGVTVNESRVYVTVILSARQMSPEEARLRKMALLTHEKVNQERTAQGLKPLYWDEELFRVALLHDEDMIGYNFIAHEGPNGEVFKARFDRANISYYAVGENIERGPGYSYCYPDGSAASCDWYSDEQIATNAVQAWMNSPEHRKNLLSSMYTDEGIGVMESGDYYYFTQDFISTNLVCPAGTMACNGDCWKNCPVGYTSQCTQSGFACRFSLFG